LNDLPVEQEETIMRLIAYPTSAVLLTSTLALGLAATALPTGTGERPFLAENDAAMRKMMHDMQITPSGDVDRDFVNMMIPHHQGAIDMAQAELRYGRNEALRRLSQEIIVTQQQEIAVMGQALRNPPPPSLPPADQPPDAASGDATSGGAQTMPEHSMHMHTAH
jgi:deoxyhypusine synthase